MTEPAREPSGRAEDGPATAHGHGDPQGNEEPEPDDPSDDAVFESDLPDLTDLPLEQLRVSGDSALAHALRRLADDLTSADEFVAGFQSAI